MKIVTWIVQILLVAVFLLMGTMKLITPYAELITNPNSQWATEFSALQIKIISSLEILGALGIILPMIMKKMRFFVPLSAIGLAMTMIGAFMVHISNGESVLVNIVLFIFAVMTAWWRRQYLSGNKN